MTDNIIRKFAVEDVPAKRMAYIERSVMPSVKEAFNDAPQLNSAVLMVAQYWCDEAHDAVHGDVVYSLSSNPDLKAHRDEVLRLSQTYHIDSPKEDWDKKYEEENILKTFIEGPKVADKLGDIFKDFIDFDHGENYQVWPAWNGNATAIPIFAAYCMEGGHQDSFELEFSSPCAILRRGDADEVTIEVLENMARPWMDGVSPEWEIREIAQKNKNKTQPHKRRTQKISFLDWLFGRR